MDFKAHIRAIQSPEPKKDESAVVKIVLEVPRVAVDVNELLDLRDSGLVTVDMLPQAEQQSLPLDKPAAVIGPDEVQEQLFDPVETMTGDAK